MNKEVRTCQACKQDFAIDPEDFAFYEKMKVPPPTWCPPCRFQRRLFFMNERALYKRECDLCGKSMVTMYPKGNGLTVYCMPCWWSDRWDPLSYGQDYDPSRPFLLQLGDLYRRTPQMALEVNYPTLVNSDYINHASTAKNCYLIYTADECENVLYAEILLHNKDSADCTILGGSELCYGDVNVDSSYRTFFSEDCESCQEVYLSKNCTACNNCFGCKGLKGRSYYIFNEPYEKDEYIKKLAEFDIGSHKNLTELVRKSRAFWLRYPHRAYHSIKNVDSTGDYVYFSKRAKDVYMVQGMEDCRYCQIMTMSGTKDACDYTVWGNHAARIYECMIVGEGADTIKFSLQCWPNVRDIEYSMYAVSSSHLFGCANIRNKQYCILNKQYAEEEFRALCDRIVRDMDERPYVDSRGRMFRYGEFFPYELSAFGYNESYAADFFPLSREEAEANGFSWYNPEPNPHAPTLAADDLPDHINDVRDGILGEIIECESCRGPFRIVPAELDLLRRFGAPLPRRCPTCRYKERLARINPPRLWHRACECGGRGVSREGQVLYENTLAHAHGGNPCPNEFETSYAPGRPEIVYCEQCYRTEAT